MPNKNTCRGEAGQGGRAKAISNERNGGKLSCLIQPQGRPIRRGRDAEPNSETRRALFEPGEFARR